MSTPISAPDFAVVRLSMPATPAPKATKNAKKSGLEIACANVDSSKENDSGARPVSLKISPARYVAVIAAGKPTASASSERSGELALALHERDAEAGDRAELGPDDHRPDDQDRRVEQQPDRGDQRREDDEREVGGR